MDEKKSPGKWPHYPLPSNTIVKRLPDGTRLIATPPPTERVLAEYRQALSECPDDAELRLHYSTVLRQAGDRDGAAEQLREAVRLEPDSGRVWSALGLALKESGDVDGAIEALRRALALRHGSPGDEQGEAILRWGLCDALELKGKPEAARSELVRSVQLMQSGVRLQRASPHLLRQLDGGLPKYG